MAPAASIGIHQEYWFHQNEMLWLDDSSLCSFFFLFKNGDPKFNGPPSGDGFVFAASDKRFCIREKLGLPGNWWLYSTQTFIENCIATTTRCSNKTWKISQPWVFYSPAFSSAFLTLIRANNISAISPEKWHQYAFAFLLQQNWWPTVSKALLVFTIWKIHVFFSGQR